MDEQTARSFGGKAAQAKLTPEERARRGRKSARTLGREGRTARSAKGWETRKRNADESLHRMPLGASLSLDLASREIVKIEPKAKRPLPKPGTMNARVLAILTGRSRILAEEIADRLVPSEPVSRVSNALSSLRTAGHAISEPGNSGREKRWSPT